MRRYAFVAGLLLLLVASAGPAPAGELAGVEMPDTVMAGEQELVLNGMAIRKVTIIKVYVAGLYLSRKMDSGEKILDGDEPRRVVMEFLRDVDRESMCSAWYDALEANVSKPTDALKKQFDQLCSWMPDVKKGDTFVFTYHPDHGTHLGIAGQSKGKLEGKPFADALFSSWIGPKPGPGEKFKQALLGG